MFKVYCLLSTALTLGAVYNSFNLHEQFYTAALYLSTNKINASILLNFLIMVVSITITMYIKLIFGQLKEIEKISLIEKLKGSFTETIFYISIFHDPYTNFLGNIELIPSFISSIYYVINPSLDYNKKSEINDIRLLGSIYLPLQAYYSFYFTYLCVYQSKLVYYFSQICLLILGWLNGEILYFFFFSRYFSRLMKIGFSFVKYAVNIFEILTYQHFENKQTIFLIFDILLNVIELGFQIILLAQQQHFFFIFQIMTIIPQLYKKGKALATQLKLMFMIDKIANVEKIEFHENICLICLSELEEGKQLSCGHIYHKSCLKTWITGNINQFCPKCKEPIKLSEVTKQPLHNPNLRLRQKILYQELKEIKINISLLQIITQYRSISNQVQNPNGIGSVQYGLPCEAIQQQSTITEIKRLQINFMNKIIRGIESGIIHNRILPKDC